MFISYDHDDQCFLNDIKSIQFNRNNPVSFIDRSLVEPVRNEYGHVNRRMPFDPASKAVRSLIHRQLNDSSKLLVLIGRDTHSSKWVQWEIETFKGLKTRPDILVMRVKGNEYAGGPSNTAGHPIKNWNVSDLENWLA